LNDRDAFVIDTNVQQMNRKDNRKGTTRFVDDVLVVVVMKKKGID
jgi:hypothetical protein